MPIVKYEILNTKRRVDKVLIVEYEVLHMKRKVDKIHFLNIICLKLENHIFNALFAFLIKTFQCNLERINESADMQAKVRSALCKHPPFPRHSDFCVPLYLPKLLARQIHFDLLKHVLVPCQCKHPRLSDFFQSLFIVLVCLEYLKQQVLETNVFLYPISFDNKSGDSCDLIPINLSCLDLTLKKTNSKKVLNVTEENERESSKEN